MIVFDAHEDLAWNALTFGRDYTKSARAIRRQEQDAGSVAPKANGEATLGLPDWLRGRVAVVVGTLFVSPGKHTIGGWDRICYETPEEAYTHAQRQIDYYEQLEDGCESIALVRDKAALEAALRTWEGEQDRTVGIVLSMEGADPIIEPAQLEEWYARGLRAVGPAWSGTRYAGGTGVPGPLTDLGHALLEAMAPLNMALDLSHMAEEAYYQALERYEGPVLASHSNPRRFCPTDRGLSDDMIMELAARDGAIGVVVYNGFLKPGWKQRRSRKDEVTIHDVAAAIDHICQVTGTARHVGLGSDFDGGLGYADIPAEFDTVADLWAIADVLEQRGFAQEDIASVLGGNFLRVYSVALPDAS